MSVTGLRTVWELQGTPCLECQEIASERKSIVSSRSFGQPIETLRELKEAVSSFMASAAHKLRKEKLKAYFLVVFISSSPFKEKPFSESACFHLPLPSSYTPDLAICAHRLLENIFQKGILYKRAGVLLGELVSEDETQYDLFTKDPKAKRKKKLMTSMDQINACFEKRMVTFASEGTLKKWQGLRANRSPHYTTSWEELPIIRRQP